MLVEDGFDLSEFDAEAANLDLMVSAPETFQSSVRVTTFASKWSLMK